MNQAGQLYRLFRAAGWISGLTVLIAIGAAAHDIGNVLSVQIRSPDSQAVLQAIMRYSSYALSIGIVLIPTWPAAFMGALIVGGFYHEIVIAYFIVWAGAIFISAVILDNHLYLTLSTLAPAATFWIRSPLEIRRRPEPEKDQDID